MKIRFEIVLFSGLCAGILSAQHLLLLPFAIAAAVFLFFRAPKQYAWLFAGAVLIGGLIRTAYAHRVFEPSHCSLLLQRNAVHGEFIFRADDCRLTGAAAIPKANTFRAVLRSGAWGNAKQMRPVSGKLFVSLSAKDPRMPKIRYGDVCIAAGTLELPGNDAFGSYLAGSGTDAALRVRKLTVAGHETGFWGAVLHFRDALLERTTANLSPAAARISAALFFGISGAVDADLKQNMIEGGCIHLFSVSGMHVALFAGLLMIVLRFVPFKLRYLLLAAGTFLYVFSTGAAPPAMRAFFMIALYALFRTFLRYVPPLPILFLTGSLLLLKEPYLLQNAGFLYSFLITASLMLWIDRYREFAEVFREKSLLMIRSEDKLRQFRASRRVRRIVLAAGSCTTAFLAGGGIGMAFRGVLQAGSIAVNLLLLPFVSLLFPLWALKVLASFGPEKLERLFSAVYRTVFALFEFLLRSGGELFPRLPAVSGGWVLSCLYSAGLLLGLSSFSRKLRISGLVLMLSVLLWWLIPAQSPAPALMIGFGGNAELPFAVIAGGENHLGFAVNAPDYAAMQKAAEFLRSHGVTQLEELAVSQNTKTALKGLTALQKEFPVRRMNTLPGRLSRQFREAVKTIPLSDRTGERNFLKIIESGTDFRFAYSDPGSIFNAELAFRKTDEGYAVTIRHSVPGKAAGKETMRLLPYSNIPEYQIYEFGK